jgi:hypothetical protein
MPAALWQLIVDSLPPDDRHLLAEQAKSPKPQLTSGP